MFYKFQYITKSEEIIEADSYEAAKKEAARHEQEINSEAQDGEVTQVIVSNIPIKIDTTSRLTGGVQDDEHIVIDKAKSWNVRLVGIGNKIQAIKAVRELSYTIYGFYIGLLEAKRLVESCDSPYGFENPLIATVYSEKEAADIQNRIWSFGGFCAIDPPLPPKMGA